MFGNVRREAWVDAMQGEAAVGPEKCVACHTAGAVTDRRSSAGPGGIAGERFAADATGGNPAI